MKKLAFILLVTMAFLGTACTKADAKENLAKAAQNQQQWEVEELGVTVDFSEIAPEIMMFVETHFPQTSIYNCHQTQHYYKVKLNDQTKLKFNHSLEWVEVDCEHSAIYGIVPASIVPEQISDYVTANFPNNHIDQIEKKNNGNWEIELDNDHEIKFDANFNVISGGGNGGGGNGGGNNSNYPEINTFVDTYFPQVGIQRVEFEANEIDVKLTDGTDIDFYLNFDWQSIDCEHATVYGIVPTELVPEQITAYVTANFPNNHIDQIEKKNNGNWEIELDNDHEIKFDANFNVISGGGNGGGGNGGGNNSNYPEINTFVGTYFPQVGIQRVEFEGNEIDVKLTDGTDIDFYLNFDWQSIDCEHSTIYGIVPTELVPNQITDYVTANFPNNHIDQIEKKTNGNWEIELNNNHEIKFDADFNVISGGNNGGGNGGGGNGGGGNGGGTSTNYPEITTFVETYFPQVGILNAHQDGNEIDVKLTDMTEIDFYLTFEWKKIDCDDSQVYGMVPTELVPAQITDYVNANFPNNHIDQIEKKTNGNWEIELNNDHEIKFDADFNVISGGNNGGGGNGGGGNGGGGNGGGTSTNYPEITTFVETYFSQVGIRKVEHEGNKYEVELTDNTEIEFNLSFEWKSIDCEESQVYGMVPNNLVPAQITDYVNANYPGKHIDKIEKKHNGGWEIELSNGLEITFDSNFNVTGIDDKK